jgi:LysM repeat protein
MKFLRKIQAKYGVTCSEKKEWIHMRAEDLKHLQKLGLPVKVNEVEVEVTNDETDNGFRTVSFSFMGPRAPKNLGELQVYLDTRYERGGPYQFTNDSKEKLKIPDWRERMD